MNATLAETKSINPPYLFRPSATNVSITRKTEELKPHYENLIEGSGSQLVISLPNFLVEAEEIGVDVGTAKEPKQNKIALVKLNKLKNETNLNPHIKPMSSRAFVAAKKWLSIAFGIKSELSKTRILLTGDGGVALEWRLENNYVSINFDENDSEMDMIFYRFGIDRNYKDLTESNLTELFHRLD